jgi:Domain of unknown function (DUF4175)
MSDRLLELRGILADMRRRWARRAMLRAWTLGSATAAAVLLVGLLAVWLVAQEGVPLVFTAGTVLIIAIVSLVFAVLPLRHPPSDRQLARFIEERAGDLDDVLVTAVDVGDREPFDSAHDQRGAGHPMAEILAADAVRAARKVDFDRVISPSDLRSAAIGAALGSVVLLAATVAFAPSATRAGQVVASYLFPTKYVIKVSPGSLKVRAGEPVTIVARIDGLDGGLVPVLTVGNGDAARSTRMTLGGAPGEFTFTLNNITVSFPYAVSAGAVKSADYTVTVIRPVRVSRIDLRFEYPKEIGLAPQTESDSGDIYAPAGTKVGLTITTDKPVSQGQLKMADGSRLALSGSDRVLTADLTIEKDGSYRVALNDVDGLSNPGDTEYFIRMLDDRPPDVRILRPAGDKQVSALEEVDVEARADDDYGITSLELVFRTSTGKESVVPLTADNRGLTATGLHTLFLEDLKVQPGDFVTYHARARDVARGRRSVEARSDVFFLEVKPYEEEFVASQSQAMAGMQADDNDVEALAAAQKDIIAATWKLDARAQRSRNSKSEQDIRAVATAQRALKEKAAEAAIQLARTSGDPRRRRGQPGGGATADPVALAVEAMGRAATQLDRLSTSGALPPEMDALNQLLKAAAEIRRRQVQRQQAQGGGGNGNRQTPDLSTLFDQELRKQQQTNYETPTSSETREEGSQGEDDPLAGIRELARRQEALTREQRELAKTQGELSAEEIKRQLEKLTREQNELRQEAEDLAKQLQQQKNGQHNPNGQPNKGGQQGQAGQQKQGGQPGAADTQKMREISEEMRNAAGDLRRQDPGQASARGDRALQQLKDLEQQMQGARPDERRRALGDLQLEARQLADAERRLGNEASRASQGNGGDDARRRLAAEQERLADRADRLGQSVRQMGKGDPNGDADAQHAVDEAARELDAQHIPERMRQSAQSIRDGKGAAADTTQPPNSTTQPSGTTGQPNTGGKPEDLARALDKVAERLGAATGDRDSETQRLSEQLARTQELRDRLGEVQQAMDALAKAGQPGQPSPSPTPSSQPGADGKQGSAGREGGADGGSGQIARLQREVDDQLRDAQRLADDVRKQNPEMAGGGTTPEQWQRSVSAPGTESFKQDFAKWESLKKNLLVALDQTESQLSNQLRARENRERLNAGRHDAVADTYRELVDRYYQSLAAPRRPPR